MEPPLKAWTISSDFAECPTPIGGPDPRSQLLVKQLEFLEGKPGFSEVIRCQGVTLQTACVSQDEVKLRSSLEGVAWFVPKSNMDTDYARSGVSL